MTDRSLIQRRAEALAPSYQLFYDQPVHLVRADGVWVFDSDGNRYLDAYNNVPSVGHCHPRVVAALTEQAGLLNTHTRYLHHHVVALARGIRPEAADHLGANHFRDIGGIEFHLDSVQLRLHGRG